MKPLRLLLSTLLFLAFIGCGDDETPDEAFSASISISASQTSLEESDATITLTFMLSETNTSGSAIAIPVEVSGTAEQDTDYEISASTATISSNQTSATLSLNILDDTDIESDEETIILSLGDLPDGISAGSNATVTITISENDVIDDFSASVELSINITTTTEGEETSIDITATLSETNRTESNISIPLVVPSESVASEDEDFELSSSSVTIASGESSGSISIDIIEDDQIENDEEAIVELGSLPQGISEGTNSRVSTIISDNVSATAAIGANESITEGDGSINITVTISETNATGADISIPVSVTSGTATADEDYELGGSSVIISNGNNSGVVSLSILEDAYIEDDEEVTISIGTLPDKVANATEEEVTVTLIDNVSATVNLSLDTNEVTEGDGNRIILTVSLSETNKTSENLVVRFTESGAAVKDADYSLSENRARIAPDSDEVTIEITIEDDAVGESDETAILTISETPGNVLEGSNDEVSFSILDNDGGLSVSITFGDASGSRIAVSDWTDSGADSYIIVASNRDSFSDISSTSELLSSTSYNGDGEQIVFFDQSIASFEVSILDESTTYYFKVYPVTGGTVDNSVGSQSSSTTSCETGSTTESQVCFDVDSSNDLRNIRSNQYPSHDFGGERSGTFPNADPTATTIERAIDLTPEYTSTITYLYDETGPPTPSNPNFWQFGMAINGVEFHPMGLKPWGILDSDGEDTGEDNWEWQAKVAFEGETDLDSWGAHVTSNGLYHYHGDILGLADEDGTTHSKIYGFAADGFPVYYKYTFSDPDDPTSNIIELKSSYQLKSGSRTGSGTPGEDYPDGDYDGTYIQDYEYIDGLGDLDECNGRTGITPEYPDGTYYYVITVDFPVIPNCFHGTPDDDWIIGNN